MRRKKPFGTISMIPKWNLSQRIKLKRNLAGRKNVDVSNKFLSSCSIDYRLDMLIYRQRKEEAKRKIDLPPHLSKYIEQKNEKYQQQRIEYERALGEHF